MLKGIAEFLRKNLKSEKAVRILVICGIAGMALVFLSGLFGGEKKPSVQAEAGDDSGSQYEYALETRLQDVIGRIQGTGRVQVLVTVRSGTRNVYASTQKTETETEEDGGAETPRKKDSDSFENEYILVKNADGSESALVTMQMQPEIQGVVVVCDGGEDTVVKQRITDAVTTVLDISSNYVCVTKMAE